jgi:molecular chaperone Hsp33
MNPHDFLQRFLFEQRGIRGEWVQLSTSWQTIKNRQTCPKLGQQLLGQALAATVLLSATIKFKGALILQVQGDGAIKTLVAQSSHDRKIRGLVRSGAIIPEGNLPQQFGAGRLVLTISPDSGTPYQGIVDLIGNNLAEVLQRYFQQSEQLNTKLWLFANDNQAVGLLLQELPGNSESHWQHFETLANTLTEQEMYNLSCAQVLYRLFHQEEVRLFTPEPVQFACSCSRDKISSTLRSLGKAELYDILREHGSIDVGCEFCNTTYQFDPLAVAQLFPLPSVGTSTIIQH